VLPISIRGVSRRFGATLALERMDLEVAAGEFVALVGPSGCGKTTLLRIVADLESPSTGEVRIGPDPAGTARQKRLLGLVSQRPAVLPWKRAVDDVLFTQRIARRAGFPAAELLREFGLAGHEDKRPHHLSGGMLQRVNIASALAHDPPVLLMDEPFSALDEMKREELGEWLGHELIRRPKTVLFVTHHIDEAVLLADRVLAPDIETVFLMPHEAYSYISSRLIKEVAGYGGSVKGLVPAGVEQRLRDKLKKG